jgi:hypothetical protein
MRGGFPQAPTANPVFLRIDADALIILPGATLQSPGCTNPVSVPPYPVGTPMGGPYPGCDPNPLGLLDLNVAYGSSPVIPSVSVDGHTAFWRVRALCVPQRFL